MARSEVAQLSTTAAPFAKHLQSADFFDAAKYPTARFVSTAVTPRGGNRATIVGNLTIKNVTKPVTLDVTLVGAGVNPLSKKYTVGFEATGTLKRSEFGVKTYVPLIGDELHLTIAGAFEKQD